MDTSKRTHYDVLGVARGANQQEIRRHYRELVRKYHPDVNPDKELGHRLLIQILEAYRALSNPSSRAEYDRRLDRETTYSGRQWAYSQAPPPPPRSPSPGAQQRRRAQATEVERLLASSRLDFLAGNLRSAAATCARVIRLDSTNAAAHMILGDIYRVQKHMDEAMSMYTIAIQLDPHNEEIRRRLSRLMYEENQKTERVSNPRLARRDELLRLTIWSFGAASMLICLFFLSIFPGKPCWPDVELLSQVTENTALVLGLISVLMGGVLSVSRSLRRVDEELLLSTIRILPGGKKQSFGITIVLLSFVWFYLGFIAYLLVAGNNGSISSSVLKAYLASMIAVSLVAILMPMAAVQLFLVGGNLAFGCVLLGWGLGDVFRPQA